MSNGIGRTGDMHEMLERLAIEELLNFHSRGLDRCDSSLLKSCYWPDAEVDYGSFKGSAHQFAELVTKALAESYQLTQHCLSNTLIAMGGKRARAESLVTAVHLLKDGQEEMSFSGRYLDQLECRDGTWKIMQRRVVMDWSRRRAVEDERESESFAQMSKGRNDGSDPSYPFFAGEN
jgi:hypothetical protein